MKIKYIISLSLAFLLQMSLTFAFQKEAKADSAVYACVYKEDTVLYSDENASSPLFVLPQSYYVLVLAKGEKYSYVKYLEDYGGYKSVYGYAETDMLLFVDYTPLRPYLYKSFEVKYSLDSSSSSLESLSSITYQCRYYGYILSGESLSAYVLINDSFGYIPLSSAVSYKKNTDYLPLLNTPEEDEPAENTSDVQAATDDAAATVSKSDDSGVIAVSLAAALLLVAGIVAVTVRKDKKKRFPREE